MGNWMPASVTWERFLARSEPQKKERKQLTRSEPPEKKKRKQLVRSEPQKKPPEKEEEKTTCEIRASEEATGKEEEKTTKEAQESQDLCSSQETSLGDVHRRKISRYLLVLRVDEYHVPRFPVGTCARGS